MAYSKYVVMTKPAFPAKDLFCNSVQFWHQIADVSVEVATVDAMLQKLCRRYNRLRRREERARKLNSIWTLQNMAILITVVVFVVVIIMWSLLWVFICKYSTHVIPPFLHKEGHVIT